MVYNLFIMFIYIYKQTLLPLPEIPYALTISVLVITIIM